MTQSNSLDPQYEKFINGLIQTFREEQNGKDFENKSWDELTKDEQDIFISYSEEFESKRNEYIIDNDCYGYTAAENDNIDIDWDSIYQQWGRNMYLTIYSDIPQNDVYSILQRYHRINKQKFEREYRDSEIDSDPIESITDKIKILQKWILKLPMGIEWVDAKMPSISDIDALLQWYNYDKFEIFIEAIQLMSIFEDYRSRLQYREKEIAVLKEKIEQFTHEDKFKRYLINADDETINRLRPHFNNKKGKKLFILILALQKKGIIRGINENELSEFHSCVAALYNTKGSYEALRKEKVKYKQTDSMNQRSIKDSEIDAICSIL